MFRKILIVSVCLSLSSPAFAEKFFEKSQTPEKKYFVGEKITAKINYLGIPVGEAVSEVTEKIPFNGREAYHIVVKVRSYRMIDLVYKVRDEHHSYVDAETLSSLSYSSKIHEGFNKSEEKIQPFPEGMQDPLSCGYFFRTMDVAENSSVFIPVYAEGKKWDVEVKTYEAKPEMNKVGRFEAALETEPLMPFRGIFFRKGKIRGAISLDKRRIPLRMTVKIPVLGNVSSELSEYIPGKE